MTAQKWHQTHGQKIKGITDRKIINSLKKQGVKDSIASLIEFTGLGVEKLAEFEAENN